MAFANQSPKLRRLKNAGSTPLIGDLTRPLGRKPADSE